VLTDGDDVIGFEQAFMDPLFVHVGAVEALQILEDENLLLDVPDDESVVPGDAQIFDAYGMGRKASDGVETRPQMGFAQDLVLITNDDFRHDSVPKITRAGPFAKPGGLRWSLGGK
jgi:hypothetical protein